MKNFIMLIISVIIMFDINAQTESQSIAKKIFKKLVFDIEAVPFSTSFNNHSPFSSYNFTIGYQLLEQVDLRFNVDLINMYNDQPYIENGIINEYTRLQAWSLGSKIMIFKWKDGTFLENTSIGVLGRFGATFTPSNAEQQSWFYDISARVNLGNVPYIGIGMNYQFDYELNPLNQGSDIRSYYISFGIIF